VLLMDALRRVIEYHIVTSSFKRLGVDDLAGLSWARPFSCAYRLVA